MEVDTVPTFPLPPPPPELPELPEEESRPLVEERTDPEPPVLPPPPPPDPDESDPLPLILEVVAELLELPDELEDPEKAESLEPDDRRALEGIDTVVVRATEDSPGPCRAP